MKGTALIFVLMAATALADELTCPEEQAENWNIEQLLPHKDCSKFYKCTFGKPVEQSCYNGLLFNLATWECDWVQNVDCGDRDGPSAPAPEPEEVPEEEVAPEEDIPEEEDPSDEASEEDVAPEEEPSVEIPEEEVVPEEEAPEEDATYEEGSIEFLPNGCPVDSHIHWLVAGENPNEFYDCVWGQLVSNNCPPTLVFNPTLQVCDWPQNVEEPSGTSMNKHLESRQVLRNFA